jgi:hypothetical protein
LVQSASGAVHGGQRAMGTCKSAAVLYLKGQTRTPEATMRVSHSFMWQGWMKATTGEYVLGYYSNSDMGNHKYFLRGLSCTPSELQKLDS